MDDSAATQPLRLFLVGLSDGFARALARYVAGHSRIVLAGVAPNLGISSILLRNTQPDLALLDWRALAGAQLEAVRALRVGLPGLRIVCVVDDAEPYRAMALAADADATISKDRFAAELEVLLAGYFPERMHPRGGANG